MSNKIRLGVRPKTFLHSVTVPMPEGGVASVQMAFKYRTRSEFGAFVDNLVLHAGTPGPTSQDSEAVRFSLQQALQATLDSNADYILQIAEGWNLDVPFDRGSVRQLCDELPGAAAAIIEAYRAALTEGRLGN